MNIRSSFGFLSLVIVVASMLSPITWADQWNKETVVTFNSPVEVPGKILPPGVYVFRLADSQSNRHIVQIFTQDHRNLLTTIQAIPDYRLQPTDEPKISFQELASGRPEAVESWFYPGDNHGMRFVYPKSAAEAMDSQPQVAVNTQPSNAAPTSKEKAVAPMRSAESSADTAPPIEKVLATSDQPEQVVASDTAVQPLELVSASLPRTADNSLILPLMGLLFLCGGSILLYKAGRGAVGSHKS